VVHVLASRGGGLEASVTSEAVEEAVMAVFVVNVVREAEHCSPL